MAYLKPQSPLKHKDGDYFYPLTTVDQVVMEDGSRLNVKLGNSLIVDVEGSNEGSANPINADTLGGYPPEYFLNNAGGGSNIDFPISIENGGTGAIDADTARANLGIRETARNLLDNSDFTNPVNQRGQTSYNNMTGYTIDRWHCASTLLSIDIVNDGMIITNNSTSGRAYIQQIINRPDLIGKNLTYVIEFADGSIISGCKKMNETAGQNTVVNWITPSGSYIGFYNADGCPAVWIAIASGESYTIKNVALYEGEYTIDTLPEYQPKGYANELLACNVEETGNVSGMELLWENASPSSDFAAQTIELSSTQYRYVKIEFATVDPPIEVRKTVTFYGQRSEVTSSDSNNVIVQLYRRAIQYTDSGVIFKDVNYSMYTATSKTFNAMTNVETVLKPYRIWGIKEVS